MKRLAALAAALIAFPALAQAADLNGAWNLDVTIQGQVLKVACTFTQTGSALSGPCVGAGGSHDTTGAVDGDKVTFAYDTTVQGQALKVTYTGEVQADGTLKGAADLGGMLQATFTGKKG